MEKEKRGKVESATLSVREQTYYILLLFGYLFIVLFGYIFHKLFDSNGYERLSFIMIIVFPIIMITYSTFYHVKFQKTHSDEESLEELEKELQTEEASKSIPVILFGLGLLLTKMKGSSVLKSVIPYLVASLFFGTVMTELLNQLIFNHYDLQRMLIIVELDFMVLSMAFGLLFMSIVLTLSNLITKK